MDKVVWNKSWMLTSQKEKRLIILGKMDLVYVVFFNDIYRHVERERLYYNFYMILISIN